jgi:hypothetical protein
MAKRKSYRGRGTCVPQGRRRLTLAGQWVTLRARFSTPSFLAVRLLCFRLERAKRAEEETWQ